MSDADQQPPDAVEQAARWLAAHRGDLRRPIVPALRERFNLSTLDAVKAAAEAIRYEVPDQ